VIDLNSQTHYYIKTLLLLFLGIINSKLLSNEPQQGAYAETIACRCEIKICWPMQFDWKSERNMIWT